MKKIFRKEVIIGLTVLISIAVLVVGIDFLKGINVFKAANYYYVTYENVEGLAVSAPVTLNGYKVGQVREINYEYDNPGHVKVEIALDKELKLPKGTKAMLQTDLLGTASIALVLAPGTNDMHEVGDELIGEVPTGMMDNVTQMLPSVQAIFPKVDTLLTSLNTVVTDPSISNTLRRLDGISANLETTTVQLNALISTLPPVTRNVNLLTSNLVTASNDITALTSKARQLPLDSLMNELQLASTNLRLLTEQLNNPNSTLGLLMHDPELYRNLNNTAASLDSLFVDIRRNPKRYISIKLL